METYTYQASIAKGSTKMFEIKNIDGKVVGSFQRYYQSTLHSVMDNLIGNDNLIVRMKAMDGEGNLKIDAFRKNYPIKKPDYYIHIVDDSGMEKNFHARQLNNILINPEFLIKSNDVEIISKTAFLDWVRFYEKGMEVARWRVRPKEKLKAYIEIEEHASIKEPLFYAVLRQMLYYIGQ